MRIDMGFGDFSEVLEIMTTGLKKEYFSIYRKKKTSKIGPW